jgi:hypothetical protein
VVVCVEDALRHEGSADGGLNGGAEGVMWVEIFVDEAGFADTLGAEDDEFGFDGLGLLVGVRSRYCRGATVKGRSKGHGLLRRLVLLCVWFSLSLRAVVGNSMLMMDVCVVADGEQAA